MLYRTSLRRLSKDHARRPFSLLAQGVAMYAGRPVTFALAVCIIVFWFLMGPVYQYSNTWQLVINTTTTIVTFLMVFLIQNSQNRDGAAMQIKLDELIRANKDAHNALLDLEELTEKELNQLRSKYEELAAKARIGLRKGRSDTGIPEVF